MTNRDRLLAGVTAASAVLAIVAAPWGLGMPALYFACKPLATVSIIVYAWSRGRERPPVRRWVIAGLVLSLGGDVALMWNEGFLLGLVSFLLAHLAYLAAFTRVERFGARPGAFAAYGAVAAVILALLWPGVPTGLRIPVVAYVVCLASMAAQAAALWRCGAERGAVLALGGALFLASDALLATNRFALALPLSSLWVLGTYWSAQWCIASWLAPRRPPHMPLNSPV